jgi:hypothetical protein
VQQFVSSGRQMTDADAIAIWKSIGLNDQQAAIAHQAAKNAQLSAGGTLTEGQLNDLLGQVQAGQTPDPTKWRQPIAPRTSQEAPQTGTGTTPAAGTTPAPGGQASTTPTATGQKTAEGYEILSNGTYRDPMSGKIWKNGVWSDPPLVQQPQPQQPAQGTTATKPPSYVAPSPTPAPQPAPAPAPEPAPQPTYTAPAPQPAPQPAPEPPKVSYTFDFLPDGSGRHGYIGSDGSLFDVTWGKIK